MLMNYRVNICLALLFAAIPMTGEVPKYSNEFLSIGAGARSFGMAGAVVASSRDVTAAYWNPSGLTGIERQAEAGLMHSEYFAGIAKYDYAGFAIGLDEKSYGGLTLIRFGVDDIPNTLDLIDQDGNLRYDRIKTFSAADYALIFSYARKSVMEGLAYGGNVKIIYRKTGEFARAWGFGFDFGGTYRTGSWEFGANARDVTSTFNAWTFNTEDLEEVFLTTGNEIPDNSLELTMPRLIIGAARSFSIQEKFGLLAEMDADITFDGRRNTLIRTGVFSIDPYLGLEADYTRLVFLRMGISNMQRIKDFEGKLSFDFQPSLGLGIRWRNFSLDYALTDISDQSVALYSNIFSFVYSFNLPSN
jgi:hypothetical protein